MLFSDEYKVLASPAESSLREKCSRFLAYAFPVMNETEVKLHLDKLRNQYPDASHHCYAYIIGQGSEAQRANDDGEPSNSAGKPILRAISSAQLTNALVVVVRYFGGTLLGIPGLINAYGLAAKQVLEVAAVETRIRELFFTVEVAFAHEQELHRLVSKFDASMDKMTYNDHGLIATVRVKNSLSSGFESAVAQHYQLQIIPN